jgi:hypothetical protein
MPADPGRSAAVACLLGEGGALKALGGGDAAAGRVRVLQMLGSANFDSALAMLTDPARPTAMTRLLGGGGALETLGGGDAAAGKDRALQMLDSANCGSALAMLTDPDRSAAVVRLLGDGGMLETLGGGDAAVGRDRALQSCRRWARRTATAPLPRSPIPKGPPSWFRLLGGGGGMLET